MRGRICFITGPYPFKERTSNTFSDMLICAVADMGVECRVIAPEPLFGNLSSACPHAWQRITEKGNKIDIYSPRYISYSNKKILNYNTALLSQRSYEKAVFKAFSKYHIKADALYGQFFTPCGISAARLGRACNIDTYVDFGESTLSEWDYYGYDRIREMLLDIKGIISVSSSNINMLLEHPFVGKMDSHDQKMLNKKSHVCPNGTDKNIFRPMDKEDTRKQLGLPKDAFIVGFAGAFVERKGIDTLVKALNQCPGVNSVFLGKGSITPDCQGILFSGPVPHLMVPKYLNACDVFVLPTLHEGCCNAILEATSCGLPVITTDLPFNSDILDGSCSFLVKPGDYTGIAQCITKLKSDTVLRNNMARAALAISENFSWKGRAEKILSII